MLQETPEQTFAATLGCIHLSKTHSATTRTRSLKDNHDRGRMHKVAPSQQVLLQSKELQTSVQTVHLSNNEHQD